MSRKAILVTAYRESAIAISCVRYRAKFEARGGVGWPCRGRTEWRGVEGKAVSEVRSFAETDFPNDG